MRMLQWRQCQGCNAGEEEHFAVLVHVVFLCGYRMNPNAPIDGTFNTTAKGGKKATKKKKLTDGAAGQRVRGMQLLRKGR